MHHFLRLLRCWRGQSKMLKTKPTTLCSIFEKCRLVKTPLFELRMSEADCSVLTVSPRIWRYLHPGRRCFATWTSEDAPTDFWFFIAYGSWIPVNLTAAFATRSRLSMEPLS